MNAGTLVEMSHLHISASYSTPEHGEAKELPERASETAQDAVSLSPASKGLLGARVQIDIEMTSIRVMQGVFGQDSESRPDPAGPLRRFQGLLKDAAQFAGLETPNEPGGVPDFFAKLREFFSPENTATRIFDFAKGYYGQGSFGGEDSEEMRTRYRDFIIPAIEQGFDEARAQIGILPDEITAEVDKTFDLIRQAFDDFVRGESPEPE